VHRFCGIISSAAGIVTAAAAVVVATAIMTDLCVMIGILTCGVGDIVCVPLEVVIVGILVDLAAAEATKLIDEFMCDALLGCTPEAEPNDFFFIPEKTGIPGELVGVEGNNLLPIRANGKNGKIQSYAGAYFDVELESTYRGVTFKDLSMTIKIARGGNTAHKTQVFDDVVGRIQKIKAHGYTVANSQPKGHTVWELHGRMAGYDWANFGGDIQFSHGMHRKTFYFNNGIKMTIEALHLTQTQISCGLGAKCQPWWIMSPFCMRNVNKKDHFYLWCSDNQGLGFVRFGSNPDSSSRRLGEEDSNASYNNGTQKLILKNSHYSFTVDHVMCQGSNAVLCVINGCSWYKKGNEGVCGSPFYCPHGFTHEIRNWPGSTVSADPVPCTKFTKHCVKDDECNNSRCIQGLCS